jgi:NAD-dependent deacetylase
MKVVFFTGSGISQESGIPTFRERNALWEDFNPEIVASIASWRTHREEMLHFHNEFRRMVFQTIPNAAHQFIAELQESHEVTVITQNVDDLHERAGSRNVIHLHGNLFEARSTLNPNLIYPCLEDINIGDRCERGSQLRPNVVWFGENLNENILQEAEAHIRACELLVIIGTSLAVYPANEMPNLVNDDCQIIVVDPNPLSEYINRHNTTVIESTAVGSLEELNEWF